MTRFMILLIACQLSAAEGYHYDGDLNGGGIADSLVSGPATLFGNAGGPFLLSLSHPQAGQWQEILFLHPLAVANEVDPEDPGVVRLWAYRRWGLTGQLRQLRFTPTADGFVMAEEQVSLRPRTELGQRIMEAVFAERLVFTELAEHTVPPHPAGGEWGK